MIYLVYFQISCTFPYTSTFQARNIQTFTWNIWYIFKFHVLFNFSRSIIMPYNIPNLFRHKNKQLDFSIEAIQPPIFKFPIFYFWYFISNILFLLYPYWYPACFSNILSPLFLQLFPKQHSHPLVISKDSHVNWFCINSAKGIYDTCLCGF